MQNRFVRPGALFVGLLILISMSLIGADAQTRRKRRSRRVARPVVTNPVIAPPGGEQATESNGEKIISTADENAGDTEQANESSAAKKKRATRKTPSDEQNMQQTINALSNQVNRLNDKLTQMQENDRSLIDMERLTRAEQRAENLRAQLLDAESKLADLQSKLEQVDYGLRPENIERAAGYGTVHPEEARDARRRQLESEKSRLQAQMRILETSQTRLETSIATADAEVDTLRRRLEQQQQNNSGSTRSETRPNNSRDRPE
jgi:DNA repair exonuclease SbcCD ATPase subunit